MAHPTKIGRRVERGFTLAGVIVLMTIMMIFVAYTVPRQWSTIMQRDREYQTIFIMQQYAKAIDEFTRQPGGALPVNLNQLKEARLPRRYVRGRTGEYIDPLTGEVDWLIIPASAAGPTGTPAPGAPPRTATSTTGTAPATILGIPMKDYAGGPFVGVKPNKNGNSLVEFNGAQKYEQWSYTVFDYRNERNALWAAAQTPPVH